MRDSKPSNPLKDRLIAMIRAEGPIDVSDYMRIALADPDHGYYTTANALGREGDFITAPEISQMFGELIGLWAVECWRRMGEPADLRLVELGPGRGTLMHDALRAVKAASSMPVDLYLVEISPALKAQQRAALQATWLESPDDVPDGPLILIANEYLDALPVRQFMRLKDGWHGMRVGIGADGQTLTRDAGPPCEADETRLLPGIGAAPVGTIAEYAPERERLARCIARRVRADGGVALIIDYGPEESAPGDSLQAVMDHQHADPLAEPGRADLTAHVDFAALARAAYAEGAAVHGPVTQARFLHNLGLAERAAALKEGATGDEAREIDLAAHRLTAPGQMGTLYKALAIGAPDLGALAGFET